ncbi:bifunctional UDP-sugar hydrolase/5'-nucleotidase [Halalkalibacter sp. AB-rgal2]|uniref:bifunctional metallophosphatase/5'-nucleotidase n=1 Tax=Halalkalibacter sp. AB-rgal2 TaxID=3242695 RepID=UPI00359E2784
MKEKQVRLFHTNDIHSGFNYWSGIVAHIKANRDSNTLYLDIGDHADRSHPITEATLGKGNVTLLNESGVDYATIGNNEGITFSYEQLNEMYNQSHFQVLLANLVDQSNRNPNWCKPYDICTLENGVKVGFIGVTAPFELFYGQLGWKVLPPIEAILKWLPILQEEADVIVLLSHLGLRSDRELAKSIEGLDVIIGGHTHHVLEEGEVINETLIAQAGKHGAYLGEVDLVLDFDQHTIVSKRACLHPGQNLLTTDDKSDACLENLAEQAQQQLVQVVTTLPNSYEVNWFEETEIVTRLCEALAKWCGQTIGMINAGVILHSLRSGNISKADILSACPHPINPCVVQLSGKALKEVIIRGESNEIQELALKGFGFRGEILGKTIFTGLSYDCELGEVHSIEVHGEPLNAHDIYSIATLDMYTFGHLFPAISEAKEKVYFMPEVLRDVFEVALKEIGS